MTLNINNNINKKYREKNLFTPDRAKNKKINKQRNISTILQSKKQNLINFPTEKSTTNLKKNISKKIISNIKNKVIKRDINIRRMVIPVLSNRGLSISSLEIFPIQK